MSSKSKIIISALALTVLCSCSWHSQTTADALPTREESLGFASFIHKKLRDSERASYDLIYGVRDGVDSFVYDLQKDYYQDYQK